ncbi:MAG: hypothetical protein P1U57_08720, partial [Oleibacter sp.]|nr:hypothetical protein [Thalassolituus sp.]
FNDSISIDFKNLTAVNSVKLDSETNKTINFEYFDGTDWQIADTLKITSTSQVFNFEEVVSNRYRLRQVRNTSTNEPVTITINEIEVLGEDLGILPPEPLVDGVTITELTRAPVDECYFGAGNSRNIYPKDPATPCPSGAKEKTNEGYAWSLVSYTDVDTSQIFIGTGSNVYCMGSQSYLNLGISFSTGRDFVCETASGESSSGALGDQRPPSIYIYDLNTQQRRKVVIDEDTSKLFDITLGLRSSGIYKGILFMAGPNNNQGATLVALNAKTGELLGSTSYEAGFSSIRRMTEFNGNFYLGVGSSTVNIDGGSGAVIRWDGDAQAVLNGDTSTLFDFTFVGTGLNAEATELSVLDNQLLVSTWPSKVSTQGGGLFVWDGSEVNNDVSDDISLWKAGVVGASSLVLEDNGNLKLLNADGASLFETGTGGLGVTKAKLIDSGSLVLYGANDEIIWSSDATYIPLYPEVSILANVDATVIPLGSTLQAGSVISSENGMISLSFTNTGDLQLMRKTLPFTRIWGSEDYEPDSLVASTYGIGQTVEFEGWIYWGTLHVPAATVGKARDIYGATSTLANLSLLLQKTHRGSQLFRGRNLGTPAQEIELLYGGYVFKDGVPTGQYPVSQARKSWLGGYTNVGQFKNQMNKMNQVPRFGRSGFGNQANQYLWSLIKFNGDLYIGTFDYTDILQFSILGSPVAFNSNGNSVPGADLYKLDTEDMSLDPIFLDGAGNPDNYGIRNIIQVGDAMYLGTAGNSNLSPNGGWQLLKVTVEEQDN